MAMCQGGGDMFNRLPRLARPAPCRLVTWESPEVRPPRVEPDDELPPALTDLAFTLQHHIVGAGHYSEGPKCVIPGMAPDLGRTSNGAGSLALLRPACNEATSHIDEKCWWDNKAKMASSAFFRISLARGLGYVVVACCALSWTLRLPVSDTITKLFETVRMAPFLTDLATDMALTTVTRAVSILQDVSMNYTTAEAGNPFVEGWYADPDSEYYDGKYWVFPTASYDYDEQTYLDAFSSTDLINWEKHPNVLTTKDVSWATRAVWAPAPISRNGKYYLYFGANDIQEGEPEAGVIGGIGVAVADRPDGPYIDAIGQPLIGQYFNGAQPIDQDVFIDDDGQAYM
ncbi:glycosyl hydrolase [Xylariaceae sp. FL1272]|nr:glycosyl hydrolase [Xylariaceae sp. FL1272]